MQNPSQSHACAARVAAVMQRLGKTPVCNAREALPQGTVPAMIKACTTCPDPGGCARLLATLYRLDAPPVFCRNAARFMRLPDA